MKNKYSIIWHQSLYTKKLCYILNLFFSLGAICSPNNFLLAQASSANYPLSTNTTGSLTDMSSGTTQLVASGSDDVQSSAGISIGFDFWFMGTRYTQFSANSNGLIRLGATAVGTGVNVAIGGTASVPYISAFSFDQKTGGSGKVHYKVTGSEPNRVLVIEWLNMKIGVVY